MWRRQRRRDILSERFYSPFYGIENSNASFIVRKGVYIEEKLAGNSTFFHLRCCHFLIVVVALLFQVHHFTFLLLLRRRRRRIMIWSLRRRHPTSCCQPPTTSEVRPLAWTFISSTAPGPFGRADSALPTSPTKRRLGFSSLGDRHAICTV
jgi:hypothetical protein